MEKTLTCLGGFDDFLEKIQRDFLRKRKIWEKSEGEKKETIFALEVLEDNE